MIFYCGFKQYIFNAENQVERIMQKLICKGGLQPQEEMEKMLIVLIGGIPDYHIKAGVPHG